MAQGKRQEGAMLVELNAAEMGLLLKLIESELEEISPEIHHSRTNDMRAELRKERDELRAMLARFYDLMENAPRVQNG